jgi:DNA-directed RNA polymerase subunit RPC12/RpoP
MSKIKCLECGKILESKHRHDFQECKCSNQTFVDGGQDYCRIGGMDLNKIEVIPEKSEQEKNNENTLVKKD